MKSSFRSLAPALLLAVASLHAAPDPPQTVVTYDTLDSQSTATETTTFCSGHVVVVGNDLTLNCDNLKIISTRASDAKDALGQGGQFKYLLATGHVHITSAQREAICGRAEVFPAEEKVVLTEDPVVTDHANASVIGGDELVLLKSQQRVLGKHVHMILPPMKDMGFHDPAPAAANPSNGGATTPATAPPAATSPVTPPPAAVAPESSPPPSGAPGSASSASSSPPAIVMPTPGAAPAAAPAKQP